MLILLSRGLDTPTGRDTLRKIPFSSYIPKMEFPLEFSSTYVFNSSESANWKKTLCNAS